MKKFALLGVLLFSITNVFAKNNIVLEYNDGKSYKTAYINTYNKTCFVIVSYRNKTNHMKEYDCDHFIGTYKKIPNILKPPIVGDFDFPGLTIDKDSSVFKELFFESLDNPLSVFNVSLGMFNEYP